MMNPNVSVVECLAPSYYPCQGFQQACSCMKWNPAAGHVPRGFCGATKELSKVKLVLVCAQPGNPHETENHQADGTPTGQLESAYKYAWQSFIEGTDLFHRNIRKILDLCFPNTSFTDQMSQTWITNSVLCSAAKEGGHVPIKVVKECIYRYLKKELLLFPNAIVASLGGKAQERLVRAGINNVFPAAAAAPPGCNFRGAQESWIALASSVRKLN